MHKELNLRGAGSYLRKSEMTDPELLAKYPFLPVIATSFEHGDGDFRPRIPQYPELQDSCGGAINAVLVGDGDPKTALDGSGQGGGSVLSRGSGRSLRPAR